MTAFRGFLVVFWTGLFVYTAIVIANEGPFLFDVFFGDIAAMKWPGQFNADFTCFLALSGLWLAWRHHFSAVGLLFGVLGFFGGAMFLFAYLLIASFQTNGDIAALMLGKERASARS
ncbi:MAG: hypothetical protein GC199_01025 [Alphaproteobacteria bacterium]|nr:hypothetical protein [Alphaproteobacteria bacterium]